MEENKDKGLLIISKYDLKRKGAKFASFGKDSDFSAILDIDGQTFHYIKKSDDKYQVVK